jgi:CBS domain-containing protein
MLRTGDRSVLVLERGNLVGILTIRDVLRAMSGNGHTASDVP